MQFYFIRHVQSENNALWADTGSSKGRSMDPQVTEIGKQQAELLAEFLSKGQPAPASANGYNPQNIHGFGITHLYCSLMDRSVYTASRIGEALDLPVHAWEELHEEGGIYLEDEETLEKVGQAGSNRQYYEANFPRLVLPDEFPEQGWWNRPFEAYELRRPRAQRFLDELLRRHGGTQDRVAAVSHGGFFNHFMAVLIGLPDIGKPWFHMNNSAITRVDFEQEGVGVIYLNRVDYLPGALIT